MNAAEWRVLVRVSQFLAERYSGPGVDELRLEVDALLGAGMPVAECTECGQDVPVESGADDPMQLPTDPARVSADDVHVVLDEEGVAGVADWIRSMAPAAADDAPLDADAYRRIYSNLVETLAGDLGLDVSKAGGGTVVSAVRALVRDAAALAAADRIVTELCDEYGVERGELVDRLGRDRLVMMAFDECVREETASLRDAGNGLADCSRSMLDLTAQLAGAPGWAELSEAVDAWRSAAGEAPADDTAGVRDPASETHRTSAAGGTDCVHPELDGPCSGCAPARSRDEIVDRFTAAVDNACDVAAIEVEVHELEPGPHGWQRSGQTSPLRRMVRALEGAGLLDVAALDDHEEDR